MRHFFACLLSFFAVVWVDGSICVGVDYDAAHTDLDSFGDDSLIPKESARWLEGDGESSADGEDANLDLFVDASGSGSSGNVNNDERASEVEHFQMTTAGERLERRQLCSNDGIQTPTSSHPEDSDTTNQFLDSLPVFSSFRTLYQYKEPNEDLCQGGFLKDFIYPICGVSEELVPKDGVRVSGCSPCMPSTRRNEKSAPQIMVTY